MDDENPALVTQEDHNTLVTRVSATEDTAAELAAKVAAMTAQMDEFKAFADATASTSSDATLKKVVDFIDTYEPMLKQFATVANEAGPDGHSPASILVAIGNKLLGLFHTRSVQAVGPLPVITGSSASDAAEKGKVS